MPFRFLSLLISILILITSPYVFAVSLEELGHQRHGRILDELWERGANPPRFGLTSFELREVRKVVRAWLPKPSTPADMERRERLTQAFVSQITSFKRVHDREELESYLRSLSRTYLNRMKMLDKMLPSGAPASLVRADVLRLASESYFAAQTAKPEYHEYLAYLQNFHHRLMQGAISGIIGAGLIWQSGNHAYPYVLLSTAVLPVIAGVMKWLDLRRIYRRQPLRRSMACVDYWLNRRWMKANDVELMEPSGHRRIQFSESEMREACDRFLSIDASTRQAQGESEE